MSHGVVNRRTTKVDGVRMRQFYAQLLTQFHMVISWIDIDGIPFQHCHPDGLLLHLPHPHWKIPHQLNYEHFSGDV